MKSYITNSILVFGVCCSFFVTGCVTPIQQRQRHSVRERENELIFEERMRQLDGRLQTIEMEISRLDRLTVSMQAETASQQDSTTEYMDSRLLAIEQKLSSLEASRVKDRQELIDTISKKIADLMAQTSGRTSQGSGYGYEHIVQQGETLSEIASAYGASIKVIMRENNLNNPNHIRVGQKLFVPE